MRWYHPRLTTGASRRATRAMALVLLLSACVRIEDGPPKHADSAALVAADTTRPAISDPSLRPADDSPEPGTRIRGSPDAFVEALLADTATTLTVVDSSPAARPSDADMDVLRRALAIPVAGLASRHLRDSYGELRGGTRLHEALDIPAARGTPVLSAAAGRVLKLFDSKAGGLMIYAADSSDRFILMYGHLDAYAPGLAEGQLLRQGQQIGTVGTTGNAPLGTPHLHFAIARSTDTRLWYKGAPVNPYLLLTP